MFKIALKMLMGDKGKYLGLIVGLSFASFIITQQSAIFLGLMGRTYGFITDTSQAEIWVMDKEVQFIDDIKPLKETDLYRVRSLSEVQWAVPMFKGLIRARLLSGKFQSCNVIGLDDASLIGGPPVMLEGDIKDLRYTDAVIVNRVGAEDKLAFSESRPLRVGDTLELNDQRARVVGICEVSRTFQSQPVIYTTYARATTYTPQERKLLSFILAKGQPGIPAHEVCARIESLTGLAAYTASQFEDLTIDYYVKKTGILINFGVTVILGVIIGAAISGQTFYTFILDNLRFLAVFKAIGASSRLLIQMTLLQILWTGFIGWGIGVGSSSLFYFVSKNTELSFKMPWELFAMSALIMLMICLFSAIICFFKIWKIEPAIAFRS